MPRKRPVPKPAYVEEVVYLPPQLAADLKAHVDATGIAPDYWFALALDVFFSPRGRLRGLDRIKRDSENFRKRHGELPAGRRVKGWSEDRPAPLDLPAVPPPPQDDLMFR